MSATARIQLRVPYICRGCGTSITTPQSYIKCPVCGIKFN